MATRRALFGLMGHARRATSHGPSPVLYANSIRFGSPLRHFCSRNAFFEECQAGPGNGNGNGVLSSDETRNLLKHIKVDDFKQHLHRIGKSCISVDEAMKLCKQTGTAVTDSEAEDLIKKLDEAGVVLVFRRRVFLDPHKVAELLAKAIPLPLAEENDPRKEELQKLEQEKAEIDKIAHRQVRNMLWGALGAFSLQSALFFRLTFWDLSWDVMEPITFFVTSSSLLVGFFFFVVTNRDPSYQDFMHTLLSSKQRKLMKKRNFNVDRLKELQSQCCVPAYDHNPRHALRPRLGLDN